MKSRKAGNPLEWRGTRGMDIKINQKVKEIGSKYCEIILKKMGNEKNHSGEDLQEINESIRILNHITRMIDKGL